ncbi:MAG TPA: ABC transporter ATP-binding protein [Pseudolabrys sp.]|nr:ABC transporter ATP-binding protein [Pseudolabrys sp.]
MPLLEVEDLHVAYGELEVVRGISFAIERGEIVTILGSNGAGKTTVLRSLAGLIRPTRGCVRLAGKDITDLAPHQIAQLGLALVPEGRQLFPEHSVKENLELGAYPTLSKGRTADFDKVLADVFELFPRVKERLEQPAGLLSGGEQQMVAIARALVSRPKVLLLDEPSLGLAPMLVRAIFDTFLKLKERGLTILLVEQMAWLGLEICDHAHVLEIGSIALSGTGPELSSNSRVMDAYLGTAI